jgi:hypothetical protein
VNAETEYKPGWDRAPDWDRCYDVASNDGEDTVYVGVEKIRGKFWTFVMADLNTAGAASDVDILGPFDDYIDATSAGLSVAADVTEEWISSENLTQESFDRQHDAIMDAASMDQDFVEEADE